MFQRQEPYNQAFSFLLASLLRSEQELKREQDEDLNVYVAHLLVHQINPVYQDWVNFYLERYDSSLYERANQQDRAHKYYLYKINADVLLLGLGIYQNIEEKSMGRGKSYYHMAAEYNRQIYRQSTGIEEVLHKLSITFEQFIEILSHMRDHYLEFIQRISDEDLNGFFPNSYEENEPTSI